MSKISYALKSIKVGDTPDDGTMSTVLAPLGNTYKGTASMKQDKATVFDVEVDELNDPEQSFSKRGKTTVVFSLIDYTPATIASIMGGLVVNGAWEQPDQSVEIEKSVQIISKTGVLIEIPRAKLRANFNAEFKEDGVALLEVECSILKPNGAAVKAIRISNYTNPVVSAGAAQNITVNNASLAGTATAFRGGLTSKLWSCISKPVNAADPTIATPTALNTNVTGLVNGVYIFQLAATDANDFTGIAKVTVTVTLP